MAQQRMNVQAPILRVLAERWSARAFDPDATISEEEIASLFEAARWAPSCYNRQPWRFAFAARNADAEAWQRMLSLLAPANQAWAKDASVLIVAAYAEKDEEGKPNAWAQHDLGLAVMSLLVQATGMGLVAHPMAGFDREGAAKLLGFAPPWRPHLAIAVGRRGDPARLAGRYRELELAARERKPLEEIVVRAGRPFSPPRHLGWEARYQETPPEKLPWHCDGLDPDIARIVQRLPAGRALDCGCGAGTQAVALAEAGWEVVAFDLAPSAIEAAKRYAKMRGVQQKIRWLVGDALTVPLSDRFDLVIDRGLLHCFAEDEALAAYLARLRDWVAPGGVLLLKCFCDAETRPEGPPRRVSQQQLRDWLGKDFEILAIDRAVFPQQENPPKAWFVQARRR